MFKESGKDDLTMHASYFSFLFPSVTHAYPLPIQSTGQSSSNTQSPSRKPPAKPLLGKSMIAHTSQSFLPTLQHTIHLHNPSRMGHVRQPVFSCLTCTQQSGQKAGICATCSITCHAEHDQVELFSRRNFQCDCGTTRLGPQASCEYAVYPFSLSSSLRPL